MGRHPIPAACPSAQQQQPSAQSRCLSVCSRMASLWPPSVRKTLLLSLAPLLSLLAASPFSLRSRYCLRLFSFVLGLGVCSVWGVLSALVVSVVRPSWRRNIQWLVARSFYVLVKPCLGWEFVVEGEEHLHGAADGVPHILVGNHQSMIDVVYIGRILPKGCVIMAKKELKYTPLLGQYMTLSRAVFVDRSNRATAVATFQKVAKEMRQLGLSLFIFAEGTRSGSSVPALLPFKKGAFHLALAGSFPIIPVVCENYYPLYSNRPHPHFEAGKLVIKVLPPVSTIGIDQGNVAALSEQVRESMERALIELSERPGAVSGRCTGSKEDAERIRQLISEGKKNL